MHRPLTKQGDHNMILWVKSKNMWTQFQHWHAMLYNEFYIAGIVPALLSLTSRGRNAPRLHYNPRPDTASFFNTFRLHHYIFRAYSSGLSWDSLLHCFARLQTCGCVVGKRETAYTETACTQGTGNDLQCLSTEYTGFDHTEWGLEIE